MYYKKAGNILYFVKPFLTHHSQSQSIGKQFYFLGTSGWFQKESTVEWTHSFHNCLFPSDKFGKKSQQQKAAYKSGMRKKSR